jgi:hypothetical protein
MLTIKKNQLAVLEESARWAFHKRLYLNLQPHHCGLIREQGISDVLNQMAIWHQRGIDYGLNSKKAIGRFLGLQLTLLPDFDLQEPVNKLFCHPMMSGEQKMTALFVRLRRHNTRG